MEGGRGAETDFPEGVMANTLHRLSFDGLAECRLNRWRSKTPSRNRYSCRVGGESGRWSPTSTAFAWNGRIATRRTSCSTRNISPGSIPAPPIFSRASACIPRPFPDYRVKVFPVPEASAKFYVASDSATRWRRGVRVRYDGLHLSHPPPHCCSKAGERISGAASARRPESVPVPDDVKRRFGA